MPDPTGTYYFGGRDIFTRYGVFVEDGSDGLLKFPPSKEKYLHDWQDMNGIDVDLSRVFTGAKEITLNMAIVVRTESEFWENRAAFLDLITKPEALRITVAEFDRSFFVYYKECTNFTRFTRLKNTNLIGCKFTLVFVEMEPEKVALAERFLIDEAGRFIVT
jgi:hypothetical protein